jgi:hypothetical protein
MADASSMGELPFTLWAPGLWICSDGHHRNLVSRVR